MRTLRRSLPALKPRRLPLLAARANGTRRLSASVKDRQKLRVWLQQGGRCKACGAVVALTEADLDHVVPLVDGGEVTDGNCQVLHRDPCHKDKTASEAAIRASNRRPDVWTPGRPDG